MCECADDPEAPTRQDRVESTFSTLRSIHAQPWERERRTHTWIDFTVHELPVFIERERFIGTVCDCVIKSVEHGRCGVV